MTPKKISQGASRNLQAGILKCYRNSRSRQALETQIQQLFGLVMMLKGHRRAVESCSVRIEATWLCRSIQSNGIVAASEGTL